MEIIERTLTLRVIDGSLAWVYDDTNEIQEFLVLEDWEGE